MKFNRHVFPIENTIQDHTTDSWKALCRYIDELADSDVDEFSPRDVLGAELYAGIFTLPPSIAKLTHVTKVNLYGSKLKRIPPEIGEMTALTYLDVYTSYGLQWFPYELSRCKNLIKSRVSTRILYGNYKHRLHFPWLKHNPVHYDGNTISCSICGNAIVVGKNWQLWISLKVGTDVLPLLVNSCSKECTQALPTPHPNYVQQAHRGGTSLVQAPDYAEMIRLERHQAHEKPAATAIVVDVQQGNPSQQLLPLKVVGKIWEK